MKAIFLVTLFFGSALAFAQSDPLTRESLEGPMFQSIGVKAGQPPQLQLRFKSSGARFLLFRDGKEDKVSDYNETVTVKLGEEFTLTEHHGSLEFTPLPKPLDQHGWLLSLNFDARSFGGKETSQYAIVLILDGAEVRFIQPDPSFDPKLPPIDPTYQRIVKLIERASLVSSHSLHADTPGGKAATPFPASATKLVSEWKLSPGASGEPIEIRWIAADTGGVAPNNHVISSSKSEPGKTEGKFTLSKPTNGFPPGKYRVELRQAEKIIYQEDFIIQ
ncbi:MAG: hypothetical protein ACXW32_10305 [Limisphaerales bacterium]